jgi:hypothetical protein
MLPTNNEGQVFWNTTISGSLSSLVMTVVWIESGDVQTGDMSTKLGAECTVYNGSYTVQVQHSATLDSIEVLNMTSTSIPTGEEDQPQVENFKAFLRLIGSVMEGSIFFGFNAPPTVATVGLGPSLQRIANYQSNTLASWSALVSFPESTTYQAVDMFSTLPPLMQNITLSFLTTNFTINNVGSLVNKPTLCNVSVNVFHYDSTALIAPYASIALGTAVCILIGIQALFANSEANDSKFSSLLQMTRNPELDSLTGENEWIMERKLTYGVVRGAGGQAVFGVERGE